MKFSIMNLGCKVNSVEAESIASAMEKKGWERVDFDEPADAALIFTCAVTNMAAQKSRKMMHRARRLSPGGIVAMVGCYTEVEEGMLEDADLIVGTASKKRIPELIDEILSDHKKVRITGNLENIPFDEMETEQFENKARAFLKVQDGCNQFCSYCIIPYTRGRERSMEPDKVIEEAKKIVKHHKEIVLAGIHTGRYGREYGVSLASLMERLLTEVPELERLRISSIEMTEVTDEMIELMKKEPRIARNLHIPLQSGSDGVLSRMKRPYDTNSYYAKIEKIKEEIPDVSISCDLIVGFPQETDNEFEETKAFLKKCGFAFLHVFPYSVRKGTPAAEMAQVDPRIKKQRMKECTALSEELFSAYQSSWVGREVEVVMEQKDGNCTKGYSSQYFPVYVEGSLAHGKMFTVFVSEYRDGRLYGSVKER